MLTHIILLTHREKKHRHRIGRGHGKIGKAVNWIKLDARQVRDLKKINTRGTMLGLGPGVDARNDS